MGGVAEELITGDDVRSPSAQLRISPAGEVEVLATHDQILAGGDVAWDPVRQTGVVFQTVSRLAVSGKVGVTAVGSSPEEAEALPERTVRLLVGLSAG